ncbi:MAG: hypothetical protein ABI601_18650 [bacterium]
MKRKVVLIDEAGRAEIEQRVAKQSLFDDLLLDEAIALWKRIEAQGDDTPSWRGWRRLLEILRDARDDPVVAASPDASDVLAVTIDLLTGPFGAFGVSSAEGAFARLEGLMEKGALGAKIKAGNQLRAKRPRGDKQLTAARAKEAVAMYDKLVRQGEKRGARPLVARVFGITERQLDTLVRPTEKNFSR